MPGFDGSGPNGQGPMTGGGFGRCTGYAQNTPYGGRVGRGFGRGFGRGRGFGFRANYPAEPYYAAPIDEKQSLEDEKNFLESRLKAVNNQLNSAE